MEHRWGKRQPVILRIRLAAAGRPTVAGWLTDISLSGAFLRAAEPLPDMGPITIYLQGPPAGDIPPASLQVPGRIVRHSPVGVGIEWDEFASDTVAEFVRLAAFTDPQHIQLSRGTTRREGSWRSSTSDASVPKLAWLKA